MKKLTSKKYEVKDEFGEMDSKLSYTETDEFIQFYRGGKCLGRYTFETEETFMTAWSTEDDRKAVEEKTAEITKR